MFPTSGGEKARRCVRNLRGSTCVASTWVASTCVASTCVASGVYRSQLEERWAQGDGVSSYHTGQNAPVHSATWRS